MQSYHFPTEILCGAGALEAFVARIDSRPEKLLIVTDPNLEEIGLVGALTRELEAKGLAYDIYSDTHSNPLEEDVEGGLRAYRDSGCQAVIGFGGGSPIDVAKAIGLLVNHPMPLAQYDDALGGSERISGVIPPIYALPTTAGTGSEVGRSAVIIMRASGKKTIFFHPTLIPAIAVLDPQLTTGLPPHLTAATGIDAFTHSMEAFFAPGFHPMADAIALSSIELVVENLPLAFKDGGDLAAREKMLIAASMGATAFQKGLGMIHSLAHPLSTHFNVHHGLANALLLPASVAFLESRQLGVDQRRRLEKVAERVVPPGGDPAGSLSGCCRRFFEDLGIEFGLARHGLGREDIERLSIDAYADPCHQTNMVPVSREDLARVYEAAV